MTQNIHEIKTLVAGLNKAFRSFEESGQMSNMMTDYVEDSIPKVIEYVNRSHSCVQKADDVIRKIQTDKVVSLTDVMYIEQAYPGFHDRTDKVFTMSDSSQGLAGAIEAINWAKAGKIGIIGAILAAIAGIIALIIKRRRDPDGVIKQMKINAKKREKKLEAGVEKMSSEANNEKDIDLNSLAAAARIISEKFSCIINGNNFKKAYDPLFDDSISDELRGNAFYEAFVDNLLMKVIATTSDQTIKDNLFKVKTLESMYSVNSPHYKFYKTYFESLEMDELIKLMKYAQDNLTDKSHMKGELSSYIKRLGEATDAVEQSIQNYNDEVEKMKENISVKGDNKFLRDMSIAFGGNIDEYVDTEFLSTLNASFNDWNKKFDPMLKDRSNTDQKITETYEAVADDRKELVLNGKNVLYRAHQIYSAILMQTKNSHSIFNSGLDAIEYFYGLGQDIMDYKDNSDRAG